MYEENATYLNPALPAVGQVAFTADFASALLFLAPGLLILNGVSLLALD